MGHELDIKDGILVLLRNPYLPINSLRRGSLEVSLSEVHGTAIRIASGPSGTRCEL